MASFEGFWAEFSRNSIPRWSENRIILAFVLIGIFALGFNDVLVLGPFKTEGAPYEPLVLLFSAIGALIAVYTNVLVQKAFALRRGIKATAAWNPLKLALGALFSLFSYGFAPVVFPPDLDASIKPYQRVGKWRYQVNLKDYAKMGVAGLIANLIVASAFALFGMADPLTRGIVIASAFCALGSVLPVPRSPGFFLIYTSFVYYALVLGLAAIGLVLVYTESIGIAISLGLVMAVLFWSFVVFQVDKIIDIT
jgi:hypothetical protein